MNKKIIIPICLIIVFILGMQVISPLYNAYKLKLTEAEVKSIELEDTRSYYNQVASVSAGLEKYSQEIDKINLALPEGLFSPALFDFFQKKTAETGLILKEPGSLSSAVSKINSNIQEHRMSFSVSGSYPAIKKFLSVLEESSRLMEVQSVSFSGPDKNSSSFSVDLSVKFYSY